MTVSTLPQVQVPPAAKPVAWKTAIVVGASSGIGAALVRRLARGGCRVAAVARRGDLLQTLAVELRAETGEDRVLPIAHDVHDAESVAALFQRVTADLGGLDAIFYAAGVMPRMEETDYDVAREREMMLVNTVGAMAWLGPAAERFGRAGRGTLVAVSSIAGERGRRANPAYCASKAALNTYVEGLRNRVARLGVKVVTIKPGFVDTGMTAGLDGLLWLISADEAADRIVRAAEKGRLAAFVPGRWALVALVIRNIPSRIFRYMKI